MLIVALDPSSTCLGFAAFIHRGGPFVIGNGNFISAGRIKPRAADPAQTRIDAITDRLLEHMEELRRQFYSYDIQVVIEISSGKVNKNRHGGGGAGLATYGDAVGSIRTALRLKGYATHEIPENKWTGGHSKDKRKRVAKTIFPLYEPLKDKDGDIADAICLAYWFIRNRVPTLTWQPVSK
jgi:Holliday junction resolvasome RuvABC endonuclease subunit